MIAAAVLGALAAGSVPASTAAYADDAVSGGPIVVPLHAVRGTSGEPRLGIDVTVGSKAIQMLVDTGSAGLRVLSSALAPADASRNGGNGAGGYTNGTRLYGERAAADVTLAGANGRQIAIGLVDSVGCRPELPNCFGRGNAMPEMFGALFPGIFGLSFVEPARGRCCETALSALNGRVGRRYLVHAKLEAPALTLSPDPAAVARFTMIDIPGRALPHGCLRLSEGMPAEYCGDVLFDTGAASLAVQMTETPPARFFARGTVATVTLGPWTHAFTLGSGSPALRLTLRRGDTNRIVVGLAALQYLDLYVDLDGPRIGLADAM